MASTTFRASYRQLKQAQKAGKGAPLYSLLVNRPLGRVLAAAAHQARLTPNQVTAISAAFTFVGIAIIALAPPLTVTAVLITGCLVLGYAFDSADGQLARLRGGGSLSGEWLDHVVDSFKIATLHIAVLISLYRFGDHGTWWLVVPLVASVAGTVHFVGMLLTELLTRVTLAQQGRKPEKQSASLPMSLAKVPTDYGILCLGFVVWGIPGVFWWFYLVVTAATVLYTLLILFVWYQRLTQLDAAAKAAAAPAAIERQTPEQGGPDEQ